MSLFDSTELQSKQIPFPVSNINGQPGIGPGFAFEDHSHQIKDLTGVQLAGATFYVPKQIGFKGQTGNLNLNGVYQVVPGLTVNIDVLVGDIIQLTGKVDLDCTVNDFSLICFFVGGAQQTGESPWAPATTGRTTIPHIFQYTAVAAATALTFDLRAKKLFAGTVVSNTPNSSFSYQLLRPV